MKFRATIAIERTERVIVEFDAISEADARSRATQLAFSHAWSPKPRETQARLISGPTPVNLRAGVMEVIEVP